MILASLLHLLPLKVLNIVSFIEYHSNGGTLLNGIAIFLCMDVYYYIRALVQFHWMVGRVGRAGAGQNGNLPVKVDEMC